MIYFEKKKLKKKFVWRIFPGKKGKEVPFRTRGQQKV